MDKEPERSMPMAKLEKILHGNIEEIADRIEDGILKRSMTSSLEDKSIFGVGNAKCHVLVFERYSVMGSNRVSLNVTLFQAEEGTVHLSAIASGGSQAMLFKLNTFGEEAFLDTLKEFI